jgi:DNA-binding MarR family transcriptional regulator
MKQQIQMAAQRKSSLENLLCLDLYAASRGVIKAYGPLLAELGLTYPQYLVLMALWDKEPLAVKDLAQLLSLDSGTLSPLLKRLEAAGLVVRTRSKIDERGVLIALTDQGRALEAKNGRVSEEIICLFGMSFDQVKSLQGTLRGITQRMEGPA